MDGLDGDAGDYAQLGVPPASPPASPQHFHVGPPAQSRYSGRRAPSRRSRTSQRSTREGSGGGGRGSRAITDEDDSAVRAMDTEAAEEDSPMGGDDLAGPDAIMRPEKTFGPAVEDEWLFNRDTRGEGRCWGCYHHSMPGRPNSYVENIDAFVKAMAPRTDPKVWALLASMFWARQQSADPSHVPSSYDESFTFTPGQVYEHYTLHSMDLQIAVADTWATLNRYHRTYLSVLRTTDADGKPLPPDRNTVLPHLTVMQQRLALASRFTKGNKS